MDPIFAEASVESRMSFLQVNVDQQPKLAQNMKSAHSDVADYC